VTVIEKRDQVEGLSITHNGHAVERLTRSRIRLWNAGRKAIEPDDVMSSNPLKVHYPGATLLDLKLVDSTDDAIKLRTKPDSDSWQIGFDYWEGLCQLVEPKRERQQRPACVKKQGTDFGQAQ
jgi:hypothetical protein